jgi:enamine deaminase RidA (YjgF/YER057c/UK114 family)
MEIRLSNPPALSKPNGYSHVAEVTGGRTIYLSGQVALDAEGRLVGAGDMRAQAQQVFANLKAALESVGADFSAVVKLTYFIVDITQMPLVRAARAQYMNMENPPASSAFEVRSLVREDLLIEIEAIAVVPV